MRSGRGLFGLALVALVGLVSLSACATAPSAKQVSVDATYSGKQVQTTVGDTVVVTLDSNPSTGFKWELAKLSDTDVLKMADNKYEGPDKAMPGAGGKEVWIFKALAPGTSAVRMEYSRPWAGGEKAVQVFDLTVAVK